MLIAAQTAEAPWAQRCRRGGRGSAIQTGQALSTTGQAKGWRRRRLRLTDG